MATTPSPFGTIPVAPPNVGPEPPGLADKVSQMFSGAGPQAKDPYALTDQQWTDVLQDTRKLCEPGRELFEYGWWRCLLYDLGRQWIFWNSSSRQWTDKRLAKWIPKPVTNKIREGRMTIQAMLADIEVGINARPTGKKPLNILTAETADDLFPLISDEHDMKTIMWDSDYWAVMLGNVFLHPHWDATSGFAQEINLWQCDACKTQGLPPDAIVDNHQRCPNCNSTALSEQKDATGAAVTQTAMIGRGQTLSVSPLELLMPLHAPHFRKVDRLIHLSWEPKHRIEEMLDKEGDGSIDKTKIQYTSGPEYRSMQLYRSLATMADLPFSPSAFSTGGTQGETVGAVVQYLWQKPTTQFPQGCYMRFIGDGQAIPFRTKNTGANPVQDKNGNPLWPWIHYPYSRVGGRLYAQGAVDIAIQKQDQLNQNDSMTQMTMQRMGNPIWLEPKGAEVERFTGEPGLVVKWQPLGAQGAEPKRIAGENPPQAVFTLRDQYMKDFEELMGTYDVIKGAKPSGVEAFSALNLLVERSQSRFTALFKNRGEAVRDWYTIALELERMHGPDIRTQTLLSPNNGWIFNEFKKADLQGDITIVIEDGSNVPKTSLGQRAMIEHLNQLGFVDPTNSDQRYSILQKFGALYMAPGLDADVKSAMREQAAWEEWFDNGMQGPQPLIRKPWNNDELHLQENRKWMNTDSVQSRLESLEKKMGPQVRAILEQQLAAHLQSHAVAMMPPPGAAPPAGGPGAGSPTPGGATGTPSGGPPSRGGPGVGAGRAMANSNQESGKPGVGGPP